MNKILIITGYEDLVVSELLYDMLGWVNITKEQAQEMFDFEALVDKFPGFDDNGGHKKPSPADVQQYWNDVLSAKFLASEKIIIFGIPARDFVYPAATAYGIYRNKKVNQAVLYLPHPSKRNTALIMNRKQLYITLLNDFLHG